MQLKLYIPLLELVVTCRDIFFINSAHYWWWPRWRSFFLLKLVLSFIHSQHSDKQSKVMAKYLFVPENISNWFSKILQQRRRRGGRELKWPPDVKRGRRIFFGENAWKLEGKHCLVPICTKFKVKIILNMCIWYVCKMCFFCCKYWVFILVVCKSL